MNKQASGGSESLEMECSEWLLEWTDSEFGTSDLTIFVQEHIESAIQQFAAGLIEKQSIAIAYENNVHVVTVSAIQAAAKEFQEGGR